MALTKLTGTITGEVGTLLTVLDRLTTDLPVGSRWTKPYTGTNVAVYRAAAGRQPYIRVNDNGPGVGSYKEARVRGYMTKADALDTPDANNVDPFPTVAQATNGHFIRKSASLDNVTRNYVLYADARSFILMIYTGDVASNAMPYVFGDFYSLNPTDGYGCILGARQTENSSSATVGWEANTIPIARAYTSAAGAVLGGPTSLTFSGSQTFATCGSGPFPNGTDGALWVSNVWLKDGQAGSTVRRGRIRGLWIPDHAASNFTDQEARSGTGALATKTWIVHNIVNSNSMWVETSDTLEQN